mmetsp:Transcript_29384/g.90931  ORF Transcript_29384/g.90931 Transcript_29384/m.90931 type:complete len:258 (+) Transcript_29384:380-1153(+)
MRRVVTLATFATVAAAPWSAYVRELQARVAAGVQATRRCHKGVRSDPRTRCAPRLVEDALAPEDAVRLLEASHRLDWHRPNPRHRTEEAEASVLEDDGLALVKKAWERLADELRAHCDAGDDGGTGRDLVEVATLLKRYDSRAPGLLGAGLPQHTDHGRFSATVLLSRPDDFVGGGTRFVDHGNATMFPRQGGAVLHGALVRHGAEPVEGVRVVLALFYDEGYCTTSVEFILEALGALAALAVAASLAWFLLFVDTG